MSMADYTLVLVIASVLGGVAGALLGIRAAIREFDARIKDTLDGYDEDR